jgi:PAS domain S-box-containing protein
MSASPMPSDAAGAKTPGGDIINSVDIPIIAIGRDCAIRRFNAAGAKLLALTLADLGQPVLTISMLTNVKDLNERCRDAIGSGASSQCEVRDATNGSWFVLRIAPYMGSEQRIDGGVLTLQNVTAFRASLEQAVYEREYTKAIINAVIDPLVVLDDECRVLAANQAFYTKFQISRDQANGARLYDIGSRDWEISRLQRFLKESHADNQSDAEFEHEFPAIGHRTVLLNARRLSQRSNLGQMSLLVIQDITERKQREEARRRAEEALRQSEQLYRELSERLELEVRARTRELEDKNVDLLGHSQQLRELSWQLLHTQDEERRHIARELHDSAGQTLAVLGINVSALVDAAQKKLPEISQTAEEIQELVQQLTRDIRTTSYLLHPPLLDENGLPAALSWYIGGLADRSSLDVTFNISEEFGRLPREMELLVFRVVQESLTNIHRHSGSKSAAIRVMRESDRVLIEVRDQGRGISPERLAEIQSKGSGVGIRGMRERLRQFHGNIMIDSTSAGTTVLATIPMPKEDQQPEPGMVRKFEPAL